MMLFLASHRSFSAETATYRSYLNHTHNVEITRPPILHEVDYLSPPHDPPLQPSNLLPASPTRRGTARYVGIYICSEKNWGGDCNWHQILPENRAGEGQCIRIDHHGGIGSIGPDCGLEVVLFREEGCKDQVTNPMSFPGVTWMSMFQGFPNRDAMWVIAKDASEKGKAFDLEAGCPI
jgi:hypothetical protein